MNFSLWVCLLPKFGDYSPCSLLVTSQQCQMILPTNTPQVFHVETTWKQLFSRHFKWNTRGVFVGLSGWCHHHDDIINALQINLN